MFLARETITGFLEEVALQRSLKARRARKRKSTAGGSENSNELIIGHS